MTKTTANKRTTAEKTFNDAQKKVQETVKTAQVNVEKAVKEATNNLDQVSDFSKANYEALVASGEAAVKVARTVNTDLIETAKKAVEKNVADTKALFAAKTPAEFFELQTAMFKSRYDAFVTESTRLNETATNTAGEVVEPLKARYTEVAEKFNLPLAG